MNWHTETSIEDSCSAFCYEDDFFSVGSCFADHIASKLLHYKYTCVKNPFGIQFHPIPLLNNLREALQNKPIDSSLFVQRDAAFFHHLYHSSNWGLSQANLADQLINIQSTVQDCLEQTQLLVITFGTAFLYKMADSNKEISNCHKMPSSNFSKELSTPSEIKLAFKEFYAELKNQNPQIKILLSVSPVRHINEGLHNNNLSKASLLLACEMIQNSFSDVYYFPAYEIMIDELRDYRFFKKDRLHPSEESIDYINRYSSGHTECCLSDDKQSVEFFFQNCKSAILMNNASTQFADGGEFGFGAEIGISTDKLHVRGPVGAKHLTTFKYQVIGKNTTRP